MMMSPRVRGVLEVLFQVCVVLLRGGNISRLEILPQLGERLRHGIAGLRGQRRAGLRPKLLQRREILLRGRHVAVLQILAELLELLLKLLLIVLDVLVAVVEEIAAGNTGYGHCNSSNGTVCPASLPASRQMKLRLLNAGNFCLDKGTLRAKLKLALPHRSLHISRHLAIHLDKGRVPGRTQIEKPAECDWANRAQSGRSIAAFPTPAV